ncbi:hypothetical protein NADFUDRAFT_50301 [Nadsonia fulvescens var. elongata DSM 6958]|uniref:Uncharacterized protein n=1 Tax=Nadsonia fulvescens var. elongata DSM 6958 TaxID=857566 RepID=A0A1E3PMG4_9ASCO|nr:hypothetical protein NADFUDRAFT_50301 [Nadsonia fulvescens var. elongata DSM 6958]
MFGGAPPPPSEEELKAYSAHTKQVLINAVYTAVALWSAPFAFELIRGRF